MSGSSGDLVLRLVVDAQTGEVTLRGFTDKMAEAMRSVQQSAAQASKATAEAGQAATVAGEKTATAANKSAQAAKQMDAAFQEAGKSTVNAFDAKARSLSDFAERLAKVSPATSGLANQVGRLAESMIAARQGGVLGLVAGFEAASAAGGIVTTVIGGAASAINALTERFVANADAASRDATSAGTTIEEYSRLTVATQLLGRESGAFRESFAQLNERLRASLSTTGELTGGLGMLGATLFDSRGNIKTSTELLLDLSDTLSAMPDGPEKSAKAIMALGESATKLLPILNQGSSALRSQGMLAEGLGASFSKADGEIANALLRSQGRLAVFVDATANGFSRVITPTITSALNTLADVATDVFAKFASEADSAKIRLAQLAEAADVASYDKLATAIDGVAERLEAAQSGMPKFAQVQALARDMISRNADAAKRFTEALDQERIALNETLATVAKELEQKQKRLIASGADNEQTRVALAQNEKLAQAISILIEKYSASDKAYQAHLAAKKADVSMSREVLEARNLEAKAQEAAQAKSLEIFNARAALMAKERTTAQQLSLDIIKADSAVIESKQRLAGLQATISQQIQAGEIAVQAEIVKARVQAEVARRTESERTVLAIINKESELAKALESLSTSRLTADKSIAIQRVNLQQDVVNREIQLRALADNADIQAQAKKLEMVTQIAQARLDNDVRASNQALSVEQKRVSTMGEMVDLQNQIVALRSNGEVNAAKRVLESELAIVQAEQEIASIRTGTIPTLKAIAEIELDIARKEQERAVNASTFAQRLKAERKTIELEIDSLKDQMTMKQFTREERLHKARIGWQNELVDKDQLIAELREKANNQTLIQENARRDVQIEIYQNQYNTALEAAKAAEASRMGLSTLVESSAAVGNLSAGFSDAAASCTSIASSLTQSAQAVWAAADGAAKFKGVMGEFSSGGGGMGAFGSSGKSGQVVRTPDGWQAFGGPPPGGDGFGFGGGGGGPGGFGGGFDSGGGFGGGGGINADSDGGIGLPGPKSIPTILQRDGFVFGGDAYESRRQSEFLAKEREQYAGLKSAVEAHNGTLKNIISAGLGPSWGTANPKSGIGFYGNSSGLNPITGLGYGQPGMGPGTGGAEVPMNSASGGSVKAAAGSLADDFYRRYPNSALPRGGPTSPGSSFGSYQDYVAALAEENARRAGEVTDFGPFQPNQPVSREVFDWNQTYSASGRSDWQKMAQSAPAWWQQMPGAGGAKKIQPVMEAAPIQSQAVEVTLVLDGRELGKALGSLSRDGMFPALQSSISRY